MQAAGLECESSLQTNPRPAGGARFPGIRRGKNSSSESSSSSSAPAVPLNIDRSCPSALGSNPGILTGLGSAAPKPFETRAPVGAAGNAAAAALGGASSAALSYEGEP